MKTRENIFVGFLVFLISVFLITQAGHAAPPDYKTMPLHQVMAELKKMSDNGARSLIINDIRSRKPETQQDRDALYEALDSRHKDVQLYAIDMAEITKETRSIKKLVDNVKALRTKSILPMVENSTVQDWLRLKSDITVPGASINVLGRTKNAEALPIMVEKLGDVTQRGVVLDEVLQGALLDGYGAIALPYVAKKIEQIGDKQTIGKLQLLYIITNIRDRAGIEELKKLSASDNLEIRTSAFRALGAMGEKGDLTKIFADIDETRAKLKEYRKKTYGQNREFDELAEDTRLMSIENRLFQAIADSKNTDALPLLEQRVEVVRKNNKRTFFHDVYQELGAIRDIGGPEAFAYMKHVYGEIPTIQEHGRNKGKKNIRYKSEFLYYFGRKHFTEAIPFLESIMNDTNEDEELRATAERVLSEITDDRNYRKIHEENMGGK